MRRSFLMALALLGSTQTNLVAAEKALVEAGKFTEVFDPKAGEKDPWCINDHTFVRGPDGTWHVFAITHILPVNFARDPGKNLLHATAKSLTQSPWHKEPFAVTADWDKYGAASDGTGRPDGSNPASDVHCRASASARTAAGGTSPAMVAALARSVNAPVDPGPSRNRLSWHDSGLSWKYSPMGTASVPMSPSRAPRFPLSPP